MGLVCHTALIALVLALGTASAADQVLLVGTGWLIVDRGGERTVELRALVVNRGESLLRYQVRFVVEERKRPPAGGAVVPVKRVAAPGGEMWVAVKTIATPSGSLAPGTSASVEGSFLYDELAPGRQYRFRAEMIYAEWSVQPGSLKLARLTDSLAASAELVALATLPQGFLAEDQSGVSATGVMIGNHEAHRVNGEWIENGSGTIAMAAPQGHLQLQYTYSARGESAAALTASATATGTLVGRGEAPVPVQITSATANMTFPGFRRATGQIVQRSGATATGIFSGTVGTVEWNGTLTLSQGTYTLDPVTGRGEHRFEIQLVRAVSAMTPAAPAGIARDGASRSER